MAGKLPYDSMADSLKTIATGVGAEVPTKRYSNKKDEIAGVLSAISDAGISGGGSGGASVLKIEKSTPETEAGEYTMDRTYEQLLSDVKSGSIIGALLTYPDRGQGKKVYQFLPLEYYGEDGGTVVFGATSREAGTPAGSSFLIYYYKLTINGSNNITYVAGSDSAVKA